MFFLDKTHPNLIVCIDALDRLQQIQAYMLEFSINFVKWSSLFKPRERENKQALGKAAAKLVKWPRKKSQIDFYHF